MDVRTTTQRRWFASHVSTLLATMMDEAPAADGDGDFPVRGETSQAWVRLQTTDPWGVHVFAYATKGLPKRAAVLREINDSNMATIGTTVSLSVQGLLVVDCFLFADAVTEETLTAVLGRVLELADTLGPVLTALHGGSTYLTATTSTSAA
jgi:hypothetical protein